MDRIHDGVNGIPVDVCKSPITQESNQALTLLDQQGLRVTQGGRMPKE